MSNPILDSARAHRRKRRNRHVMKERQVETMAQFLGVAPREARIVWEWLFDDIPLDTPIEKRRWR